MKKHLKKIFSFTLIPVLIFFSTIQSYTVAGCGVEMESCCCNESYVSSDEVEFRGSCCDCSISKVSREFSEKPKIILTSHANIILYSAAQNDFLEINPPISPLVNPHNASFNKESIFLVNLNLRI